MFNVQTNISVDLALTAAQDTGDGLDTLVGIENLQTGSGNDGLTGNLRDNVLSGGAGDDILIGADGNDQLFGGDGDDLLQGDLGDDLFDGGLGIDTAILDSLGTITVDLSLTTAQNTGIGVDTFTGIENVVSGAGADSLTGDFLNNMLSSGLGNDSLLGADGNDSLLGGVGDDSLEGGSGDDQIDGGAGTDTAIFVGAINASVDLRLVGAQDTGFGLDTLIGIENLTSGSGSDVLIGNALSNALDGGLGNDTLLGGGGADALVGGGGDDLLIGGGGADVMTGGAGNDSFSIDTVADIINESAGGGTDTAVSAITSLDLASYANVEWALLTGLLALNLTGSAVANVLSGNDGANSITGLGGNDALLGNGGDDILNGGGGADSLDGGMGIDVLTGGGGIDTFVFSSAAEAGIAASRDQITDFLSGVDLIDLSAFMAGGSFIGSVAFSNAAGQVRFNAITGVLQGDVDGNGSADFAILLNGTSALTSGDFVF